jgi:hypothetical protein
MMFKQLISVYVQKHMKSINKNVDLPIIKQIISTTF